MQRSYVSSVKNKWVQDMDKKNIFSNFFNGPLDATPNEESTSIDKIDNNSNDLADSSEFSADELDLFNQSILDHLRDVVPPNKFRILFEKTFALHDIQNQKIFFLVGTEMLAKMISDSYKSHLSTAILNTLGENYEIQISVSKASIDISSSKNNILHTLNESKSTSFYEKTKIKSPKFTLTPESTEINAIQNSSHTFSHEPPKQTSTSNPSKLIDPNKNFANFISGSSNNLAFASAFSIAQNPGKVENSKSLYIYSDSGLGKTHLLHAIANKVNQEHPNLVVFFISATDFINQFVDSKIKNTVNEFMKKYTTVVDILMIDDIHGLSNKEGTQDVFFQIFNSLYENKKQLIFTSDKKPKDILGIPERLKTRLQWGLIVDIQRPDYETKISILKSYAAQKDIFIPDTIIELMASAQTESIRELEGFINLLSHVSGIEGIPIDENLAKKYLRLEQTKVKKITPESITKNVATQMKLNVADIKSTKRTKDLAIARHIAIYLTKKHTHITLKEIGQYFGGRNHSTILSSIAKIEDEIKINIALSEDIIQIEKRIH